jgi:hypothetical protein
MATPTMKTTTYLTTATAPKSDEQSASVALLALATIATDARTGNEKEVLLALHQQACIEQKHPAAALAVRDFWDVSAASTSRAPTVPSRRPLPATRASVPPPATPCSLATPVMTKWPAPSTKRSSPAGTSGAGIKKAKPCKWKGPITLDTKYVMQLPVALLPARPPSTKAPPPPPPRTGKAKWRPTQQLVPGKAEPVLPKEVWVQPVLVA